MKRFWVGLLVLIWGSGLLASCGEGSPPRRDFAYAEAAFTAVVRGTYTVSGGTSADIPRAVAAEVSVGAPTEDGRPRDVTVSFTAPPALAGVTARAVTSPGESAPTVTFSAVTPHGTVTSTATRGEYDGLLRFARALIPVGDVAEVSATAEDGTHTVTRRTAEGDGEAVYLFAETGGLPLRVTVRQEGWVLELTVTPRS